MNKAGSTVAREDLTNFLVMADTCFGEATAPTVAGIDLLGKPAPARNRLIGKRFYIGLTQEEHWVEPTERSVSAFMRWCAELVGPLTKLRATKSRTMGSDLGPANTPKSPVRVSVAQMMVTPADPNRSAAQAAMNEPNTAASVREKRKVPGLSRGFRTVW